MQFHYKGGRIDLVHAGPAHTAGDTAVIFREHNAVHLGDVFNNTGFPFIDADSGGEIDGMIAFCEAVAAELEPGAIVIPGHGPVTDTATLARYIAKCQCVLIAYSIGPPPSRSIAAFTFGISAGNWSSTMSTPSSPIETAMLPPTPNRTWSPSATVSTSISAVAGPSRTARAARRGP